MTSETFPHGFEVRKFKGMNIKRHGGYMSVEGMRDEMGESTFLNLFARSDGDVSLQLKSRQDEDGLTISFAGPTGGTQHPSLAQVLRYIPHQMFEDEGASPFLNEIVVSTYQEDLKKDNGKHHTLQGEVCGIKGDLGEGTFMDILVEGDGDVIVTIRKPESDKDEERKGYVINFNEMTGGTMSPVMAWAFRRIALSLVGNFPYKK